MNSGILSKYYIKYFVNIVPKFNYVLNYKTRIFFNY